MKKITTLLFAICIGIAAFATDYTIEPKAGGANPVKSRAIPMLYNAGSTWGSVSQQIYLASELTGQGAGVGDISAITFYYSASSNIASNPSARNIQIFLMQIPAEQNAFAIKAANAKSDFLYVSNTNKTAGTKVYEGDLYTEAVTTEQTKTVKLNFDNSFAWDGSSNIVLTVFDMSATSNTVDAGGFANIRFLISKTTTPRFLSWKWFSTNADDRAAWIADMSNNLSGREGEYWSTTSSVADQTANRSYVNKVDFSITPAAVVIPAPTGLSASASTTSATLSWNAVDGATGYNVKWGTNAANLDHSASNVDNTSLDIDELIDGTTYYFAVQTITAGGTSAYSDAVSFETDPIVIVYKGITFSKWNMTDALPYDGNWYLSSDVTSNLNVSISDDLNLCLNGHDIYMGTKYIKVPDGKSLAIYDNVGGGRIYGYYVAEYPNYGLINVEYGGSLTLCEGIIENLYGTYVDPEDPSKNDNPDLSYAIMSNGTLKLSGAPVLSGVTADIYLYGTNVITIESGKPLTNTSPYKIYRVTGAFTSGWANMSGANPADHFVSSNSSNGVCYNGSEAALVTALNFADNVDNTSTMSTYTGQLTNVIIGRSFTSASFNTICLPFPLNNAQLTKVFGDGYDLEEFDHSTFDGEALELIFAKKTGLVEGAPYLIKPSVDVVNPVFEGVTFHITEPESNVNDDYISFHGIFAPTSLEGGNKNLLFLGAGNELFWPESTGNMNGFRAYFEVKGAAQKAAKHARIVQSQDAATALDQTESARHKAEKFIRNGQLIIERNGFEYNAQGQLMK